MNEKGSDSWFEAQLTLIPLLIDKQNASLTAQVAYDEAVNLGRKSLQYLLCACSVPLNLPFDFVGFEEPNVPHAFLLYKHMRYSIHVGDYKKFKQLLKIFDSLMELPQCLITHRNYLVYLFSLATMSKIPDLSTIHPSNSNSFELTVVNSKSPFFPEQETLYFEMNSNVSLLLQAMNYKQTFRIQNAIDLFLKIDQNWITKWNIFDCFLLLGKYEESKCLLIELMEDEYCPNEVVELCIGFFFQAGGYFVEALSFFESVAGTQNPQRELAKVGVIQCCLALGPEYKEAMNVVLDSLKSHSSIGTFIHILGVKELKARSTLFKSAMNLSKRNIQLSSIGFAIGGLLTYESDLKKASVLFRNAIETSIPLSNSTLTHSCVNLHNCT